MTVLYADPGRCAVARCRGEGTVKYLGRWVCDRCWTRLADDDDPNALRRALKMDDERCY